MHVLLIIASIIFSFFPKHDIANIDKSKSVFAEKISPELFETISEEALTNIYIGRTPCQEFANDYGLRVTSDCFKLKWKLTLNRDIKTRKPTTYLLQTTFNRQKDISGTWSIRQDSSADGENIVYILDGVLNGKDIFLLANDANVLFLIKNDAGFYPGNAEFSYTLNRSIK